MFISVQVIKQFIIVLCCDIFLFHAVGVSSEYQEGEPCQLRNNERGFCTSYHLCKSAVELSQHGVSPVLCNVEDTSTLVCCGERLARRKSEHRSGSKLKNEFLPLSESTEHQTSLQDEIEKIFEVHRPISNEGGRKKHSIAASRQEENDRQHLVNDRENSERPQGRKISDVAHWNQKNNEEETVSKSTDTEQRYWDNGQFHSYDYVVLQSQHQQRPQYQSNRPRPSYTSQQELYPSFESRPTIVEQYNPRPATTSRPSYLKPYEPTVRNTQRPRPSYEHENTKLAERPVNRPKPTYEQDSDTHPYLLPTYRPRPSYEQEYVPKTSPQPATRPKPSYEQEYESPYKPKPSYEQVYTSKPTTQSVYRPKPDYEQGLRPKPKPSHEQTHYRPDYDDKSRPIQGVDRHPEPDYVHKPTYRPSTRPNQHRPIAQEEESSYYRPTKPSPVYNPDQVSAQKPQHRPDGIYQSYPTSSSTTRRPNKRPKPLTISERKCKEYSEIGKETISGIPLVIDPRPIEINVNKCNYNAQQLIVGGKNATVGEFPHMAAVGYLSNDKKRVDWKCGGSLISEHFVLTAAHCTKTAFGPPVVVRLGELNLKRGDDGAHPVDYLVKHVYEPDNYTTNAHYNDIALLRLSRRVTFTDQIKPACLHSKHNINFKEAVAPGWGRTNYDADPSDMLLKVVLSLIDNEKCNSLYRAESRTEKLSKGIDSTQLCAGNLEGGEDTCQGDSGGPIEITSQGNRCIHHIIGITSFGKRCALRNAPGVYTRVSSFIPWVEKIVWPNE